MKNVRITNREIFIEVANNVHNGLYDYDKLIYNKITDKGIIICPIHGEFEQKLTDHVHSKSGCPICSGRKHKSTEEFITDAIKVHGDLYDYSKFIYLSNKNISTIICKSCDSEFKMKANSHLSGQGCPKCGILRSSLKRRKSQEKFIIESNIIHNNKFDYSLTKYHSNTRKVKIICPNHGEFEQTPGNHLAGHGCFKCMRNKIESINRKDLSIVLKECRGIHGDYYKYDLSNYKNVNTKIKITCPLHGDFHKSMNSHINDESGCPECFGTKGEASIIKWLKELGIGFETQKRFYNCINPKTNRTLPYDFYISSKKICIEYDGPQHFKEVKIYGGLENYENTKYRDNIKTRYCYDNSLFLLRISYLDYDNIEKILKSILL